MDRDRMQRTLTSYLDAFKRCGLNTVMFQVRCEGDALYPSKLEPWSYYLTGRQGQAPNPYWDPLQWMIDECHKRGMELHAWINPYRAKTAAKHEMALNHPYNMYPDHFFKYGDLILFDPGEPYNREYICRVVSDIMRRYDVDGIHMDDYFYPYPGGQKVIPDDKTFAKYNNGIQNRADWRRYNVNLFMKQLHDSISRIKPWVKFGVSPFGIYRNKKSSPMGSDTNGLQNYDDLYADVLLWINNGWVDYCVPQIYWQIGHPAADYETLIRWWDKHAGNRPLYIGEDVERTAKYADLQNAKSNQMPAKFALRNEMRNVKGAVLWYAKAAVDNIGQYGSMLRTHYWKYPALQPAMPFIDGKAPKKVKKLKAIKVTPEEQVLFWTAPKGKGWKDQATAYVVYHFMPGEKINLNDASKIAAITRNTHHALPQNPLKRMGTYVVTALDRMHNESKGVKTKVKR